MTAALVGLAIAEVLGTSTGGVGTHLRGLIAPLLRAGAKVRVHGPQATEDLFGFTRAGARFAPVPIALRPRPGDLKAAAALRGVTSDVDLIHAHGIRAGTVAALANLGRRTPLVVTLHNAVTANNPLLQAVYTANQTFLARTADVVLGASPDLVDGARAFGARDARFAPVGAPPLPAPTRSAAQTRTDLGVSDSTPLLLSVGRLHRQKGYDVLVPASLAWLSRELTPQVVIAGDGPLQEALQAQINATGAPIRLLGRRNDVADLLQAADLVLLPSRWEARSLVAQEAMRAGRALVTTPAGGMAELVGSAARVVPVGDVDALAAAVTDLLDRPDARESLAAAGLARSASWPTEDDTAAALSELYAELTRTGGPC